MFMQHEVWLIVSTVDHGVLHVFIIYLFSSNVTYVSSYGLKETLVQEVM